MEEITTPVDLVRPDGKLNPGAVGFTRRPLHSSGQLPVGIGHGWRTKRWEYWGISTDDFVLGLTIAHLDYAGILQAYYYDRNSGQEISQENLAVLPKAGTMTLPDTLPPFRASATIRDMRLRFEEMPDGRVVIWLQAPRLQAMLEVAPGEESLGVVVPWSEDRFQYTLKQPGRGISGTIEVDGESHTVDEASAHATLDRGRGRWPYSMTWNWGSGAGTDELGRRIGLQVGGKWTDGTGATENALFIDGKLLHRDGDLHFDYNTAAPEQPWTVTGDWLQATLTPFHTRKAQTNALIVSGTTYQAFGSWSGWATTPDGESVSLDGLTGWIEEASNRW